MDSPKSYLCDTLPAPRLARASSEDADSVNNNNRTDGPSTVIDETDAASVESSKMILPKPYPSLKSTAPSRKLCVRHQRMADEGVNMKLQQVCALFGSPSSSTHSP